MEINAIKTIDVTIPVYNNSSNAQTDSTGKTDSKATANISTDVSTNISIKSLNSTEETTNKIDKKTKKEPQEREVQDMTEAMNKFMTSINADLQFSMHQRTQRLMVQMVDSKDKKVLKEFPPKEFLDMVAKIRDYVGAILDKKI